MGPRPYRGENPAPLIRPSVRTGVPSPKEEGVGSAQIGRNLPYCGTFRYIYWELWRSAPVGGGRPSVPPLRQKRGKPGRRAESSRPTKGVAGTCPLIRPIRGHLSLSPLSLRDIIPTHFGLRPFPPDRGNRPLDKGSRPPGGRHDGRVRTPAPTGIVGKNRKKQRAHNVRPYRRGGGNLAPHPPQCAHWGTFPPGGRLRKNKKGQVWDLSLKTWRRSGASQKVLLVPFLSRKGTAYFLFQREQAVGESAV